MNSSRENHRLYMKKYSKTAKNKEYMRAYFADYYKRNYARKAKNERQRKYREKYGYPVKDSFAGYQEYLKRTYGLSVVDYNKMLSQQDFRCAICRKSHTVYKRKLAVDHNHTTGKVRGLLCHHCNSALGNFKDNISYLGAAAKYLQGEFK